ncbi:MAG: glucose-6-phosphate dehydrogenase, partial [Pseudomonadota bacterium]
MSTKIIPVEPFDFVVFGATGDLSERKLIPALYHRLQVGQIVHSDEAPCRIIGASRSKMSRKAFQDFARKAIEEHVTPKDIDKDTVEIFLSLLHYIAIDATTDGGWNELKELIGETPEDEERIRLFYLAVGPTIFPPIVERLASFGLNSANSRLVIEKPIGRDLNSAHQLNDTVGEAFGENQVFRIDHYLGKETVQNLMALRFANILYEPVWNNAHIDHVQITVAETLGVGTRGNYYDKAGAMRDMVQNHLLQLLCPTAMEPPARFDANAVRDEKLKVLRALTPIGEDEVKHLTVKGQYRAGAIDGEAVPA